MRVTGSTLPLLSSCQWWARPDVQAPAREPNAAMLTGTEVHAAIEKTILNEALPEFTTEEASEYYATWLDWWLDGGKALFGDADLLVECAYSYSPSKDSGKNHGRVGGRNYPETGDDEIIGTVDAIAVERNRVTIVDWKTGDDRGGFTADASENKQLRGYALAATRAHNVEEACVMIVRIGTSGVKVTSHTLDAFDLADAATQLRDQLANVPNARPAPGTWCARCRAVSVCPATIDAAEVIAPRDAPPAMVPLTITQENAAPLLERLGAVRAMCDALDEALRAFADANGPFVLSSGKSWGKVTTERSSIKLDGPEGADAIAVLDGTGLKAAVETTARTSRAAIERVVKAQGLKGKEATARVQATIDELRRVGAVRTAQVASYKEQ